MSKHSRGAVTPPKRSTTLRAKSPVSPRQSVRPGRDNGVFLLQEHVIGSQHRDSDLGRQEMRMQFLSKAGDEWAASLRSPSPPPKKDKSLDLEELLQRDS